ncbi:hypothetical protein C4J95_3410 [Pseudomonas orientalis]|uniref:hypothetical protein n=1 Tax=Pseudomonas orientalis TaxID=76758 RepID=UPI000F6DF356|nr:hypothetical protein [Pseudomonas orientalis]AZE95416.1 hypothetical protein C4J96_3306 [Pseudomonas orientalis]AZF00866.1 hypothetical protein C4J95_3410 [Pseudomonas orientalis]
MFVSNVNHAVSGYAEASNALNASGFSNEVTPASATEQLSNLVNELERLLGVLSARFESTIKVRPLPAPAVNNLPYDREVTPDGFIRGTAANTGVKPGDIFKDFYQTIEGNCVTVSAIKAAMMRFGHNPHGIYKSIHATEAGYHIVMRDGCELGITHGELEEAKTGANFGADQPNDVLVNAQFLYAVSAKRAYHENNDGIGKQSFAAAMRSLNDGEYPGQALRRLGLKDFVAPASLEDFLSGAIGTVDNGAHSMAVVDGFLDVYGFKQPMRDRGWSSHRAIGLKLL